MSKKKNYKDCIPSNSSWMADYANKMGRRPFWQYLNRVYVRLDNLQIGSSINIDKLVREDNIDLFIKCAYDFILHASKLTRKDGYPTHCFRFSEDFKTIERK